ncbi:MAG: hypothetical protein AAF512_07300 [Pseudomonadota bacterium]
MKQFNELMRSSGRFLLLILVCLALGPELFIYMPEIVLFLDIAGLEFIMISLTLMLKSIRDYLSMLVFAIKENKHLKRYGILVLFILLTPVAPELILLVDAVGLQLAVTCLLTNLGLRSRLPS